MVEQQGALGYARVDKVLRAPMQKRGARPDVSIILSRDQHLGSETTREKLTGSHRAVARLAAEHHDQISFCRFVRRYGKELACAEK